MLCFTFLEAVAETSSGDHLSSRYSLNLCGSAMEHIKQYLAGHDQALNITRRNLYVLKPGIPNWSNVIEVPHTSFIHMYGTADAFGSHLFSPVLLSSVPRHQAICLSVDGRQVLPESCTDTAHIPQGQCVAVMVAEGEEGAEGAEAAEGGEGAEGAEGGEGAEGERGQKGTADSGEWHSITHIWWNASTESLSVHV